MQRSEVLIAERKKRRDVFPFDGQNPTVKTTWVSAHASFVPFLDKKNTKNLNSKCTHMLIITPSGLLFEEEQQQKSMLLTLIQH